jgi:hypothetical protein
VFADDKSRAQSRRDARDFQFWGRVASQPNTKCHRGSIARRSRARRSPAEAPRRHPPDRCLGHGMVSRSRRRCASHVLHKLHIGQASAR